ncbi:MAG: S1 RNA-binding domain-containing protein [Anaerolineales bacterium]|nr:S1 RNA-binding domain-containing protein [Anaerolineales bacterium]
MEHQTSEMNLPSIDEGWWEAVLAEAEQGCGSVHLHQKVKMDGPEKPSLNWDQAMMIYRQDQIIKVVVTGYNRGGLLVEGDGLSGFIPCSHLVEMPALTEPSRRDDCLSSYVGQTLRVKVIECVPDESRMVFSERAARSEAGKRMELFSNLQPGQRVSGEVTNITEFGIFVDLGGVEGLIHISELSWGRVNHPGEILRIGERVEVLVIEVSPERCRVALSLKRMFPNPWENAIGRFPINSTVPAVVTALVPFGAFARLEEGLEGLIHTSEIPMPAGAGVNDVLRPGQKIQVRILQVDVPRQRIGLSMRTD